MALTSLRSTVETDLEGNGFAVLRGPFDPDAYRALARSVGVIVGEERIALRPGAHAYVAKPGAVPLHTDQPEVDIVAWHCERQDETDGASLLFDTWPFVDELPRQLRRTLYDIELQTPPLTGGPPTLRWPVLRRTRLAYAVFCSPWLVSASACEQHVAALEDFRRRIATAIGAGQVRIRLRPGEVLLVDNRRVLHGREAIAPDSRRLLRRLWVRR